MTKTKWKPKHEQVELPELGFAVDRGMEDLIRACWHRGIATFVCCIEAETYGHGYICFELYGAAHRWEAVTGQSIAWWNDNDEIHAVAEARFTREEIPLLLAKLNAWP